MEIVHNEEELKKYFKEAVVVSGKSPVLIDHYLKDSIEVDVDAVSDGKKVIIAGIMNILRKQESILVTRHARYHLTHCQKKSLKI